MHLKKEPTLIMKELDFYSPALGLQCERIKKLSSKPNQIREKSELFSTGAGVSPGGAALWFTELIGQAGSTPLILPLMFLIEKALNHGIMGYGKNIGSRPPK